MQLHEITEAAGAYKNRKRRGRGEGSGLGKTSGRGNKGCQSRSGGGTRPLHEGGQMPIFRRLPKRGFSNANFRTEYCVVNLVQLERYYEAGTQVDVAALKARGLVAGNDPLVKVLGKGTLSKKLTVTAHAFSAAAKQAIEQAGGTVNVLPQRDRAALAQAKRPVSKKGTAKSAGAKGKAAKAEPAPAAPTETTEGQAPESAN